MHGNVDSRARRLIEALESDLPDGGGVYAEAIERLRSQLLKSDDILKWERPWLAHSDELRGVLDLPIDDERFPASMTTAEATKASRSPDSCRALMALVAALRPKSVLEMGTNVGISGAYIAAGLEIVGQGSLATLEGSSSKAALAERNFRELGFHRTKVVVGDFAETLLPTVERVAPIDLAFIDGFHDGEATLRYHELIKKHASVGAVLLYDDINWSPGMRRAWEFILRDPDIAFAADDSTLGMCGLR